MVTLSKNTSVPMEIFNHLNLILKHRIRWIVTQHLSKSGLLLLLIPNGDEQHEPFICLRAISWRNTRQEILKASPGTAGLPNTPPPPLRGGRPFKSASFFFFPSRRPDCTSASHLTSARLSYGRGGKKPADVAKRSLEWRLKNGVTTVSGQSNLARSKSPQHNSIPYHCRPGPACT